MTMYALVELHDEKYQPLADLTWESNKVPYANRHGYQYFCKKDNLREGTAMGYQKIWFIKELMNDHPEIEWFWWTGTDTMIMNFSTRLEDRVNNAYHFMVCVDVNGINADSFLIRNTPQGREFIDSVIATESQCAHEWDCEQRGMANVLGVPYTGQYIGTFPEKFQITNKWKDLVKLFPQRYMNGYNYNFYHYTEHKDSFGYNGNWNFGDWLIHWPAINLENRINLYHQYKVYIIE